MIPRINQVIKCYQEVAQAERMKCGRPGELTAKNAVRGAAIVCEAAGIPLGASVERLTRKAIDSALVKFLEQGIARVSAWSYMCQLRAVFAKWTRPYYEDRGWEIPKIELPNFRAQPPRYVRPSADLLRNVKAWYKKLEKEAFGDVPCALCSVQCASESVPCATDAQNTRHQATGTTAQPTAPSAQHEARATTHEPRSTSHEARSSRAFLKSHEKEREWLAATFMLEFAMRNGDILRLTPSNFIESAQSTRHKAQGTKFLSYTPHKTELSSGRRVCWPIHPDIWAKLGPLVTDGDKPGSALLRTLDSGVFERLNRQMRLLGFTGGKGAYELRKICIDHIYQKFGAEKATAISGDDIKTITHYYADPAAVTVVGIRILDLL